MNNEVKDSGRHALSSLNSSAIIGVGDSEAMCVMSAIFQPLDMAIGRGLHPEFWHVGNCNGTIFRKWGVYLV